MANFISNIIEIESSPEHVFSFLKKLPNLRAIMPDQIENWKSNEEECSFFIKNLGDLGLKKGKVDSSEQIRFPSSENSKVKFDLIFHQIPSDNEKYKTSFEVVAEMNSLVEMMAKRPLTNFVNLLNTNLQNQL
ncbi:MAG: hypothetical protein B6D64_07740 [Bacteroidetes bacterium 4484_276]|nr:MAG: hypothetical protein B6D64_07740 [Bacteroidetes bacterium 4484_276]